VVRIAAAIGIGLPAALLSLSAHAQGRVETGRELAKRLCAYCHMGEGQSEKSGPGSIPGFAAVARRPGQTEAAIVSWLASKPQAMPDHNLSLQEMNDLAAFIMTLGRSNPQR
jgi:mono/diheme cytochrome c family protein